MIKRKMYVIMETSEFMMSYVIVTGAGNCIIVDGGRPEDIPLLREKVKGKKIKAWFLTHPHLDHIDAFTEIVKKDDPDFDIEKVYYNFPSEEYAATTDIGACSHDLITLKAFNAILPKIKDKAQVVYTGDVFQIDDVRVEILYHFEESYGFKGKDINETSLVFRVDTDKTSVMFLGDLGPEGGDILVERGEEKLKAEYCQMAHHGHAGVSADVYMLINPKVCIWNAKLQWLINEEGKRLAYRRYGFKRTWLWMERLGVKEHVLTRDGTAEIDL